MKYQTEHNYNEIQLNYKLYKYKLIKDVNTQTDSDTHRVVKLVQENNKQTR